MKIYNLEEKLEIGDVVEICDNVHPLLNDYIGDKGEIIRKVQSINVDFTIELTSDKKVGVRNEEIKRVS